MKEKISLEDMGVTKDAAPTGGMQGKNNGKTLTNVRVPEKKSIQTVDISDFVEVKPKKSAENQAEEKLLNMMNSGIERTKKELMENVITPFKEACIAASLEDESDAISPDNLEDKLDAITGSQVINKGNSTDDDLAELLGQEDTADGIVGGDDDDEDILRDDPEDILKEEEPEMAETKKEEKVEKSLPKRRKKVVVEEVVQAKEPEHEVVAAPDVTPAVEEEPVLARAEDFEKEVPEEDKVEAKEVAATPVDSVAEAIVNKPNALDNISDLDLQEFLDEETDELTEDEKEEIKERQRKFREEVNEKLKIPMTVDKKGIAKFRIATKPVSVNKVLKTNPNKIHTATWALPNSGRLATYSALSGEEIENLNPDAHDSNMSTDMANRLVFNTLFSHLVDPNKPETMEEWLRTINWFDINDIYFGVYLATFKDSNFVAYTCDDNKCRNIFLEDVNFKDMIKYADDKAEAKYKDLLHSGIDATPSTIPEDIVPISPQYAIGFRAPSVYDIIFGASSLDARFRAKYATTIGNISYMANVYYIKGETLFPVDCKPVADDPAKTMRNRIVVYYNILKTLSSDQYSIVTRTINEINNANRVMATFHYPDSKCKKCGKDIKRAQTDMNPLTMLFIRHQLVQSANITIE
jgi:hypothetical protein